MIRVAFIFAAFFSFLGTSAAQCTLQQQITYISALPNPSTCGPSFLAAENTPSGSEGIQALDVICTTSCAGAFTDWLEMPTPCNDSVAANAIRIWCQPADGGSIPRCRFAFDQLDPTVLNNTNLDTCATFMGTGICPPTCTTALSNISTIMGCCYQGIYNNSMVLDILQNGNYISATDREFLDLLRNSALWEACNVDVPPACSSPTFRDDITTTATSTTETATTAGSNILELSLVTFLISYLGSMVN